MKIAILIGACLAMVPFGFLAYSMYEDFRRKR